MTTTAGCTEWGVKLGVKAVPTPKFITFPDRGLYGWKIDRFGILVYGESRLECEQNFISAYHGETGINLAEPSIPLATLH